RDEEEAELAGDPSDATVGDHRAAAAQAEDRTGPRPRQARSALDDAERLQLLLDQVRDVASTDQAAHLRCHPGRDLTEGPAAVGGGRYPVEQARDRHHAPVTSAEQVLRLNGPAALVLSEELDALGKSRWYKSRWRKSPTHLGAGSRALLGPDHRRPDGGHRLERGKPVGPGGVDDGAQIANSHERDPQQLDAD